MSKNVNSVSSLDFAELRRVNAARADVWTKGQRAPLAFALMELAGETGEACNVGKKLARAEYGWAGGTDDTSALADELGDVVICADLAARTAGIDLAAATAAKFNKTSEKHGFPHRLAPTAVDLIAAERQRQIIKERWTPAHDDAHVGDEIARAAAVYAMPERFRAGRRRGLWAWASRWWKPTPDDRVRELVKAGALIVAEIERLQRLDALKGAGGVPPAIASASSLPAR